MGKLIASDIPNLISGVSQQPWNVRLPTQAEEQINCYSSVTDFLRRRPSTRHIAKLRDTKFSNGCAEHHINRDEVEKYTCLFTASSIDVFDLRGQKKTVNAPADAMAYLSSVTNPETDLRFLTINDYTFVLNRKKTVEQSSDLTPKRSPEALVFIKQASYNTTYYVTLDGKTVSFTTLDGVAPSDQPADKLSSKEIAENLASQLTTAAYSIQSSNNTIWIRKADGTDFTVKAEDTRSNTHVSVFKNKVQRFSDLPTVAPTGFTVEIYGDSSSSFDNYYCQFEPTDSKDTFGAGLWKETVQPGIPYKLNAATMPHALVRNADGTFEFKPLEWAERVCGDEKSAALPSFVDRAIKSIFFYRNRLSFLSEENVVMSEVGEFFNFFPTTVTTMVDSDRIDVAASHVRSNTLESATIFSGGLLMFSDQCQFSLEHDTTLSNATVSVKPVTEFEASVKVVPVSSGKTVFFATEQGAFGGLREYITLPDSSDQNDAADVTAHVPRYIKGHIRSLVCSTGEDVLLVLGEDVRSSIWIYKYFWNGSEKIQSAWFRFDMCGDVVAAFFINTLCYCIMQYDDGVYLEVMDFAPGHKDENSDFEFCLDRKITDTSLAISAYDSTSNTTRITLPYSLPTGTLPVVVTRPSSEGALGSGELFSVSPDLTNNKVFVVEGDVSGKPLYVGVPYTSSYTFSTFAIRESEKGNAVTTGRLQLRSLTLNCSNTGYLRMLVTPAFRNTSTYKFTGRQLGHGSNRLGYISLYTGTVKCPILSLNTQVTIRIESDAFLPFAVVNASWEGFYNTRDQRV
jgi:hypothetical protein